MKAKITNMADTEAGRWVEPEGKQEHRRQDKMRLQILELLN